MSTKPLALLSKKVITPKGLRPAAVLIRDTKIEAICSASEVPADYQIDDFNSLIIAPGIVDAHVHINEPGRTEWEGFETATKAAATGGITTLVDMPLNSSPVTTSGQALQIKRDAAVGNCWVNVGFYGGLITDNVNEMEGLIRGGVLGIKAFLCDSGLADFPAATKAIIEAAMPILQAAKIPFLTHAELVDDLAPAIQDVTSYQQFSNSRPSAWELSAIEMLLELLKLHRGQLHIVHLATGEPILSLLKQAKKAGLNLSVETCPHYLFFATEDVPDCDPRYKCAPPIRSSAQRQQLRQALVDGTIDTIGSDHSPCPPEMKYLESGDLSKAWGGIAGLQFMLPAVWTSFQNHEPTITPEHLSRWLSSNPAKMLGLEHQIGSLAPGLNADVVVWDPLQQWTVTKEDIAHRHRISPYESQSLVGKVLRTYVNGHLVFSDGEIQGSATGELLRR